MAKCGLCGSYQCCGSCWRKEKEEKVAIALAEAAKWFKQRELLHEKAAPVVAQLIASTPLHSALVFPFSDAPLAIQELSTNGGDEDWVAILPEGYPWAGWTDGIEIGCYDVEEFVFPGGTVRIGSHA